MNNLKNSVNFRHFCFAVTILAMSVSVARAQKNSTPKRLHSPAIVKNLTGGESHDEYVIRVRKNQSLTVQISWKENGDRAAAFVISRSADFFAGDVLEGGRETYDGKNRTVKIHKTGDYYIYVTAHPAARYTLKVSLK